MERKYLLSAENDPMGEAIKDFFENKKADKLRVFSSQFEEDEMPVRLLFREYKNMPVLERKALDMAEGRILDVGAGSGCHSLALQQKGKDVEAIDISSLAVEVMKKRGIVNAYQRNFFDEQWAGQYDSILMLMNGVGIVGKLAKLPLFFKRVKQLLSPGGAVWLDSSDLKYLYEDEDGSMLIDLAGDYYGEVDFQMQYKNVKGEVFDWLYVDFQTLSYYAAENGFYAELVHKGEHYDYLAKLTAEK